ncbi:hypothetical protein ACFLZB_02120 [Nanoarchaeota archaeon]
MKKVGVILVILVLFSVSVMAQQFHPAEQVSAGTFGIGDFVFNGSVGIGVASPSYLFDIQGGESDSYIINVQHTKSTGGRGIYAVTSALNNGIGVYGHTTAGSGTNWGVYGRTDSSTGMAIRGYASSAGGVRYSGYFRGGAVRFPGGAYLENYTTEPFTCTSATTGAVYFDTSINGDPNYQWHCCCIRDAGTYAWKQCERAGLNC